MTCQEYFESPDRLSAIVVPSGCRAVQLPTREAASTGWASPPCWRPPPAGVLRTGERSQQLGRQPVLGIQPDKLLELPGGRVGIAAGQVLVGQEETGVRRLGMGLGIVPPGCGVAGCRCSRRGRTRSASSSPSPGRWTARRRRFRRRLVLPGSEQDQAAELVQHGVGGLLGNGLVDQAQGPGVVARGERSLAPDRSVATRCRPPAAGPAVGPGRSAASNRLSWFPPRSASCNTDCSTSNIPKTREWWPRVRRRNRLPTRPRADRTRNANYCASRRDARVIDRRTARLAWSPPA